MRILFSRITLKDIFAKYKRCDIGMVKDKEFLPFHEGFIFGKAASAKFRKNKTLGKNSKFTVLSKE